MYVRSGISAAIGHFNFLLVDFHITKLSNQQTMKVASLVFVTVVLQQPMAVVAITEKPLIFHSLDNFVACGDGSPAGIYTDALVDSRDDNINAFGGRNNHVINFQSGGGCGSEQTCRAAWIQKPYMLSSLFEPEFVKGSTFVSNDPTENPEMASFVKWLVPYCSQDMWIGSGKNSSGFVRSGSAHVNATLMHWLDAVQEANATVDTLVVSGVSAGTFAVLNHVDLIRSVSDAAEVKSLRLLLDASLITDRAEVDFGVMISDSVDPNMHPLCFKNSSDIIQHEELSQLPCCLSTHCMLRHSKSLTDWLRINPENPLVKDERILLIDTVYDILQTFSYLISASAPSNSLSSDGLMSLTGATSTVFNIGEFGGMRKARVLETLYAGERHNGPNVVWAMPSAIFHNTLITSLDIFSRICQRKFASSCDGSTDCIFIAYPEGISDSCNASGVGITVDITNELRMTSWTTTDTWKRVTVEGKSIQEIIYEFVRPNLNATLTGHARLMIDSCPGPNCVPEGQLAGNSAQSFIEIEDTFTPIPSWLIALVTLFLYGIVILYISMANWKDDAQKESSATNKESRGSTTCGGTDIRLRGLCVESRSGEKILEDVNISLGNSTLNCLLGKSGSGKSTLLGVLSCQLKANLDVSLKSGTNLSTLSCTYMRQLDLVTMENMTPIDYLRSTSKVYGVNKKKLDFVLGLVKPFFPVKKESNEKNIEVIVLDPFKNAMIKELSGGQRRMLAIAAALFQNTSLLILDEPLSGLDSVSSMKVINLLKFMAKENAVTVFMTMHQPSNEILDAMDEVVVLAKGKVIFDSKFDSLDNGTSSAAFIHEVLSETEMETISHSRISAASHQNKISVIPEGKKSEEEKAMLDTVNKGLRLWQIQPLVRRLHLEFSPKVRDVLITPICFLIISAWGSIDATNPLLTFLLNTMFTGAPAVLYQEQSVMNWDMLSAHLWDLEDNRVSPVSYMLASGFRMFYIPIISIPPSLALAYAALGWQWKSFWVQNLFSVLTTVALLQFGKTLSAGMKDFRSVASSMNVALYLGVVLSGTFVNPSTVPSSLQWIMYFSTPFWGMSGSLLNIFQHSKVGQQPCQSFVACMVYNPSVMAHLTGYASITTARTSMIMLIVITATLVLIEYVLLRRKVVQRSNYTTVIGTDTKMDEIEDESEQLLYQSTASERIFSIRRDPSMRF